LLDFWTGVALPPLTCSIYNDNADNCENDELATSQQNIYGVDVVSQAIREFGIFDWTECYVTETDETTGEVSVTDERNAETGSAWIFCDEQQVDLNDADHPCASNQIEDNVVCRGENSCKDITLKASALCWGENSCNEAVFKPQLSSGHTVTCAGKEACRDARGFERDEILEGDEDLIVYTCAGTYDADRTCEGSVLSDNTACYDDEACKDAEIEASVVTCSGTTGGEDVCKQASITTDLLNCDSDTVCSRTEALIDGQMWCTADGACEDAEVILTANGQLKCTEAYACEGAVVRYKLGTFSGNNSLSCQAHSACADAEIRVETICAVNNTCDGANIYADVMCADTLSCEDTYMSQGTVCCGPGCALANTREFDDDGGGGCTDGDLDDDPVYGPCGRCGKETLLGLITRSNGTLGVFLTVSFFLLLIGLCILMTICQVLGLWPSWCPCQKGSVEVVDEEGGEAAE